MDRAWLDDEGYDALEDLVFTRADETGDAGWTALSAMLASRELHGETDEATVLAHARPASSDNPRAWAVALQVRLALERDHEAKELEGQV